MRKISVSALALALTLGASGLVAAQSVARPDRQRTGQGEGAGWRGRGGPRGMLLKGITLSASQKSQLKDLRTSEKKDRDANGAKGQVANGRGAARDTAGMGARRAQMEQHRAQQVTAIRSILTADQRPQFDKNVAEMKTRVGARRGGGKGFSK